MRDSARIDQFLAKFSEAWKLSSNLRFGQLIYYLYGQCERNPYMMEDDEWEALLQTYIDFRTDALFPVAASDQSWTLSTSVVALPLDDFLEKFSKGEHRGFLAAIHVNNMEEINKAVGVRKGDQFLRDMAITLSALLRGREYMGRMPGAEYVVCLNAQDEELLKARLKIFCKVLTRTVEKEITAIVGIGLASLDGEGASFEECYKQTQIALRSIFNQNESAYAIYNSEMLQKPGNTLSMLPGGAADDSRVFIRTFGAFDVFVDGRPISFYGAQSKELLALLVDRRGGFLNSAEAISYLWEDEPSSQLVLSRLRKVALRLKRSLEEAGIADIVEYQGGMRRVVPEKVRCDYYDYLRQEDKSGVPRTYMSNYSWAEDTLANLISDT